jgi:hypothetical protein
VRRYSGALASGVAVGIGGGSTGGVAGGGDAIGAWGAVLAIGGAGGADA